MNKRIKRFFEPGARLCFVVLALFAVATFFFGEYSRYLAYAEAGTLLILLIFFFATGAKRRREEALLVEDLQSFPNTKPGKGRPRAVFS